MREFNQVVTDKFDGKKVDQWNISKDGTTVLFISIGVHISIKFYDLDEHLEEDGTTYLNVTYHNKFKADFQYDYRDPSLIDSVKFVQHTGTYGITLFADTLDEIIELCESKLAERFEGIVDYSSGRPPGRTIRKYEGSISVYELAKKSLMHSLDYSKDGLSDRYHGVSQADLEAFDLISNRYMNAQAASDKYSEKMNKRFLELYQFESHEVMSFGMININKIKERVGCPKDDNLHEFLYGYKLKLLRKVNEHGCFYAGKSKAIKKELEDKAIIEGIQVIDPIEQVIQNCTISGNAVSLPDGQLDKKTYAGVKKKLEDIGGKWKTNKQAFVFESDPTELLARISQGEKVNLKQDFQFFSTPLSLGEYMVELAEIDEEDKVLEPSAGDGAILKLLLKTDSAEIDAIELMEQNFLKLIEIDGIRELSISQGDFLKMDAYEYYTKIVANPPFTKNQDIDHVRRMFMCLAPGGRIVTIMSQSWLTGTQKKQVAFKKWLEELGATIEKVDAGAFKESGTNVATTIVTINKPK